MIDPKDVKKMAGLARIELTQGEEEELSKDLEAILDYVDTLKAVDIEGIEESEHTHGINETRSDETSKEVIDSEALLVPAARQEKGFIKVKKILEK